jgi:cyclase
VVVAIDTKPVNGEWMVFTQAGKKAAHLPAIQWAKQAEKMGAGEILLTSIENDGTKSGFSIEITDAVSRAIQIPVIASGGAGTINHFKTLFEETQASAALAASIFHYQEISIPELKKSLTNFVR